ncbi:extracellular solute-binding protein [Streptococcus panodentis]|uniref:HTH lacI-type domain-containing protein n=1 Tax=Streptococcus panodentis TaxID=1581472 RepID=A0ABS5AXB3_9STRE|nr:MULTISPECIES: extracellular solute-binding protein [Streptococcus]KXT84698.1 ABC-type sugar transport system, periplasmic component [Streptococcus sp. DD11]MBP2621218.1 hypothetical protein [Streptococcus panodentis]
MVTIKDIAKMAGVSHGTASNVLNKKGNVSTQKIQLVEEAAKKLGYQLNSQAQLLRKKNSDKVVVLLPMSLQDKYTLFLSILSKYFYRKNIEVEVSYIFDRKEVDQAIEKRSASLPKAIVCCGMRPTNSYLSSKNSLNIYYVDFWSSKKLPKLINIGFNHDKTFYAISDLIQRYDITDLRILSHELERDRQFIHDLENYLDCDNPIPVTRINDSKILLNLFELVKKSARHTLVVSTSPDLTELFMKTAEWNGFEANTHIVTICNRQIFHQSGMDYIELNIEKCANAVARKIDNLSKEDLEIQADGLYQQLSVPVSGQKQKIKMLTIESPMTEAMKSLLDKYHSLSGIEVKIDTLPYHLLYELVMERSPKLQEYELVRLDMAWLRSVDKALLQNLQDSAAIKNIMQKFDAKLVAEYVHINDELYTIPLDISVQMLFYRKDLFEDKLFQRRYFETTREHLKVPENFKQFDRITRFLRNESIQTEYNLYGHTISDLNPILSYSDFIPRLKEKIKQEAFTEELFEKTLEEYTASRDFSLNNSEDHWRQVADNFALGKTAMEIIYSNYAFRFLRGSSVLSSSMIGVADIPGQSPLLGGGCLGIIKNGNNRLALDFMTWLYSDEILQVLSHLGGFVITKNAKNDITLLNSYPWLEDFSEKMRKGSRFHIGELQMTFEKEKTYGEEIKKHLQKRLEK